MRVAILGAVLGAVSLGGCSGSGESEEVRRFMEDVAECRPGEFTARENVGAGRYAVDGPAEDGGCRVTFAYVEHPNPGYVGQELSFVVDPEEPVREQIRAGVAECLEARNGPHHCEGELFRAVGGVEAVPEGPMLCGQPVEEEFGEPLYPLPKDGAWGYVDAAGEWVIEPRWTRAGDFHEGRAIVAMDGAWGIIDRQGEHVVEPRFGSRSDYTTDDGVRIGFSPLKPFSEGCAAGQGITALRAPFFVGRNGAVHWRTDPPEGLQKYDVREFGHFSEGLAWFRTAEPGRFSRYGWVDADGNVVIEPEYAGAGRFDGGLAPAGRERDRWGFIDVSGELKIPGKWTLGHAGPFTEGMAYVDYGTYDYAYMPREGNGFDSVAVGGGRAPADIKEGAPFSDGLAPVIADLEGRRTLMYATKDGTAALIPDEIEGIHACAPRHLPAFRDGLVRLLVADDGENCGDDANGNGLAEYRRAHYVYLDRDGKVALEQTVARPSESRS